MAKLEGTHHVLTASITETGSPVYLTSNRTWSASLADAWLIASAEECERELAAALTQERLVADPYSFMVVVSDGRIDPQSQREEIRATGPTTPLRRPDSASARA
jgi:Protein of unknown function (DUF2849)